MEGPRLAVGHHLGGSIPFGRSRDALPVTGLGGNVRASGTGGAAKLLRCFQHSVHFESVRSRQQWADLAHLLVRVFAEVGKLPDLSLCERTSERI